MTAILGLGWTAWSWLRSSRIAQIALLIGVALLMLWLYGRGKKAEGAREAINAARDRAMERMERNREVHREIRDLPLSERARRLRELS